MLDVQLTNFPKFRRFIESGRFLIFSMLDVQLADFADFADFTVFTDFCSTHRFRMFLRHASNLVATLICFGIPRYRHGRSLISLDRLWLGVRRRENTAQETKIMNYLSAPPA
jgi:hypothetical protein